MGIRKSIMDEATRIGGALGTGEGVATVGDYEISSAFASPSRKKLMGYWLVVEHLIGGQPFMEKFRLSQLKGAEFSDSLFEASYEFKEFLCIKKVRVEGTLEMDSSNVSYAYRLAVALSWRPGPGKSIVVRPEIGYQMTSLGGEPAACRDLPGSGEELRITYRFEGRDLVLEEGEDRRLLRRS